MRNNFVRKLQRDFGVGILSLAGLVNCGDTYETHEHNYPSNGDGQGFGNQYSCEAACDKFYACNPQNGSSVDECIDICISKDFPKVAPGWLVCVEDSPCDTELGETCEDYLK